MIQFLALNTKIASDGMGLKTCVHCGREFEEIFNRRICSDECGLEIS